MKKKIKSYLKSKGIMKAHQEDFFHLDSAYFPEATKKLLPLTVIREFEVLPLGFKTDYSFFRKKRTLNLGMIHPEQKDIVKNVEAICRKTLGEGGFDGIHVYLITREEFQKILKEVYHV